MVASDLEHYYTFLQEAIGANAYGRFPEDRDIDRSSALQYAAAEIKNIIAKKESRFIESKSSDGAVDGLLVFRQSAWDSSHFGFPVVLVDSVLCKYSEYTQRYDVCARMVSDFAAICKSEGIRLVMSKSSSQDLALIHACEHVGFQFIESWIYNKIDLRKFKVNPEMLIPLRSATDGDMEVMQRFAWNSFATQRFHADKRIPYDKAEELYQKWIATSFADERQKVLVHDVDGKPAAFSIYFTTDLTAQFGLKFTNWKLALIDPEIQGKGLGALFFHSLFAYHQAEGSDVVDSGLTLRNIASLNLHNKLQFKVTSTLVSMHLWL